MSLEVSDAREEERQFTLACYSQHDFFPLMSYLLMMCHSLSQMILLAFCLWQRNSGTSSSMSFFLPHGMWSGPSHCLAELLGRTQSTVLE